MDQSWWLEILKWALLPILSALLIGTIEASRFGRNRPGTLRQPIAMLLLGGAVSIFFGFILYASNTFARNETATWLTSSIFAVFMVLGLAMVSCYFTDRHGFTDTELTFASILGIRKTIRWSEVVRLRYSFRLKWFHVEDGKGTKARINAMLVGLPEFALMALQRVPPSAIDADTKEMLTETSLGNLPPL